MMKVHRILVICTVVLLSACGFDTTAEETFRAEQNFAKVELGMTRSEVENLMGEPAQKKDIGLFEPQHSDLRCTDCELWIYLASEGGIELPQVAFDIATGKVTQTVREESDKYFNF